MTVRPGNYTACCEWVWGRVYFTSYYRPSSFVVVEYSKRTWLLCFIVSLSWSLHQLGNPFHQLPATNSSHIHILFLPVNFDIIIVSNSIVQKTMNVNAECHLLPISQLMCMVLRVINVLINRNYCGTSWIQSKISLTVSNWLMSVTLQILNSQPHDLSQLCDRSIASSYISFDGSFI